MNTNSNVYTVIYSTVLVVVVAAILAFAAEGLKDKQNENVKLETITKVLTAAAQSDDNFTIDENTDILATYRDRVIDAYFVDFEGKKVGESMNLGKDDLKNIQVASTSDLKKQNDIIKKIEKGDADAAKSLRLPVYVFDINDQTITVLPIYGAGLWGPVWGYLAFAQDGRSIDGAIFDHKSETPGLGAKIAEEPFYGQFKGHKLSDEGGFSVVKGGAHGDINSVDAISGASITSQAVGTTINIWMKYYLPYLNSLAEKNAAAQQLGAETEDEAALEAAEAENKEEE
mgnify:FL=1